MTAESDRGRVSLDPSGDVVAGTYRTWELTYTVGALGMDDGSTLRVAASQTADWGRPQFDDPAGDNYATVETDGDAAVTGSYESKAYVRPYNSVVQVDVSDGALAPGETITLTLGETGGGSPGHRAQTFPEEDFELRVLVDPVRTGEFVHVDTLSFDVVAGRAQSLVAVAPATLAPGEEGRLRVRAEDYWGNRAREYDATLDVNAPADVDVAAELAVEAGVGSVGFTAGEGVHRLSIEGDGVAATANPTVVDARYAGDADDGGADAALEADDGGRGGAGAEERGRDGNGPREPRTYFGDPHGQSGETVGTGTVEGYFAYARDSAFVDFAAHAGNDFQITDDLWERILAAARAYNDPGSFVTFPCYEWSANTPNGGDHNVYFRDDGDHEIHRSSRWLVTDEDGERADGTYPVEALYDRFAGREDVLIVPHQGGRPATPASCDPELTPFVEIASVWGVFEWFGQEALAEGYRVGFGAGTDDHSGRPGATRPDTFAKHNLAGGLMGVQAPALTRAALWEAFRERRIYATTGARIRLDTRIAGAPMGTETDCAGPVEAELTVNGTAPIQEIDLFRGGERVAGTSFDRGPDRLEVRWRGARGTGRDKAIDWSGSATLDRGEITGATAVGIDRPTDGITAHEPTAVRWTAITTGNHQAVRLNVDAPGDATLSVATEPATLGAALGDVDRDGEQVAAPGLDAALELRRVGARAPLDVESTLSDPEPPAGTHPYYVRVRQADGEMAWSSPTFVDCGD